MEVNLECPQEFEVRQPRWLLVVSIILLVLFVGIASYVIYQTCEGIYDIDKAASIIIPSGVATLFTGIMGLYSYCNDTFKYTNGEFLCKRTLRRTKKWNIDEVSYVEVIRLRRAGINILFYDKNNKKIASVTDGIWVWEDGRLRTLLYIRNIPLKGNAIDY